MGKPARIGPNVEKPRAYPQQNKNKNDKIFLLNPRIIFQNFTLATLFASIDQKMQANLQSAAKSSRALFEQEAKPGFSEHQLARAPGWAVAPAGTEEC
jgi:hypothetical protein